MRVRFSSIASLGDIKMLGKNPSIAVSPYSEYQAMISSFYSTFLLDRSSFIYFCFSAEDPKHFQIILNHLRSKAEGRQSFKNPCVLSCKDRVIAQVLLFGKRVGKWVDGTFNRRPTTGYPESRPIGFNGKDQDSHAVLLPKDPRDLRDLFIEAEHFGLPELRKRPESLKQSWLRLVLF